MIPGRGRTELRATYNKPVQEEDGTVVGRVDDVANRIRNPKATTITLHSDDRWFRPGIKIVDGAFRVEDVTPCRFRLALVEACTVLAETDWFELMPAATVDTVVLTTDPAGGAVFTVERSEGTAGFEPKLYLRRSKRGSSTAVPIGRHREVHADNLTPGDYTFSGYFKGMVSLKA
ncbi:MAG: hypothetical protein AAF628_29840 [Planctomycetota bacterium]